MTFLTHLECGHCKKELEADRLWNLCPACEKPLLARYDLEAASKSLNRNAFGSREMTLWRYRELLPIRDSENMLSLGEGYTPIIKAERLAREFGTTNLFIKDESHNPTGSFKDRGLSVAVSRARELGATSLSIPTAGNAGGSMSAYSALAGLPAYVFMPEDVPKLFPAECRVYGAEVTLVDGLITDCGRVAREGVERFGRFDLSTLKEPYRLEGKKTMGYEIAEQMGWELPDAIIYPTGGGTGLVGMWKAFAEMESLGWIGPKRPRMVSVQMEGCAPIVKAFHEQREFAEPWEGAETVADGLRVPSAVGDFLILKALRESSGTAVAVSDPECLEAVELFGRTEGIFACPEGGAALAAYQRLSNDGWIREGETAVVFNTGSGLKYAHLWDKD
ncbi:MAG: threonine synthase [Candidatus Latescibacteria bacterium]|nr:threonine synthase [Candidatus Latescibacterota bacterium]NIM22052.1 threonine synthase [Candidatus Latescibacterota bacterium]NIM66071.1 threonine synthase [Candidatus Latescibacterota bacterium]NIO02479.1 threonine synthase [Candidatus Latescibacterota bacterium]NIO29390.1 threonine synthase [Candidatus Latescibacterota bacterium]